jgi:phenylacetate-CoA ligase
MTSSASAHDDLRASLVHAYDDIPFYEKKRPRPVSFEGSPTAVLSCVPLLWKHEVRASLPKEWVPRGRDVRKELETGEIELVETSGSTGERTRILWDKGWWLRQEERGMRTNELIDRAMSSSYREAILTTPVCGLGTCHTGDLSFEERTDEHRLFLNMRADPTFWKPADMDRMLNELLRQETVGLESDPTYLATLARHAKLHGRSIAATGFVTLTYALTSAAHVRALAGVVSAPVFQLYGASEVGVLFMQGTDGLLHHCPRTTHVELLPVKVATPGAADVALVVVTTLDRTVQPLVRFVVGDLVQVAPNGPRRFTSVAPIVSAEGRIQDALIRPDGAWVTAGALDRVLATHEGVASYQANQTAKTAVVIDVVPAPSFGGSLLAELEDRTRPLLDPLDVTFRLATGIAGEPSGKFRLARRHFTTDLGALLDAGAGVQG